MDNNPPNSPKSSEQATLKSMAQGFPSNPGVYLMRSSEGKVLYVGKARNLKKRVTSYFKDAGAMAPKTVVLMSKVTDIQVIITTTEKEALLLESSLIKKHRPNYNVVLRDDKNYPLLRLSLDESFPRLSMVRRMKKDGAAYFGPYSSSHSVRETLRFLERIFPLRKCKQGILKPRNRPCLNYQMHLCLAPCLMGVDKQEYQDIVKQVTLFLQGRNGHLMQQLKNDMAAASREMAYERAAKIRDKIKSIERTLEKQVMVSSDFADRDVLGIHLDHRGAQAALLFIRQGILIGSRTVPVTQRSTDQPEITEAFLKQYYGNQTIIPPEILIPTDFEDRSLMEEVLADFTGHRVKILVPQRGDKLKLVTMAGQNAAEGLENRLKTESENLAILEETKRAFGLSHLPETVQCFDISNIQGVFPVGSLVTFENGRPKKSAYRIFKVKSLATPDDYAMMYEVLKRSLTRSMNTEALPDLLMVDGGKGQLNVAVTVKEELRLTARPDLLGMAKDRDNNEEQPKFFIPGRKNPIILPRNSPVLFFLTRIRDEAHRFAISHHQKLRRKSSLLSLLDDVPGVGTKRRKGLLTHFGSLKRIREASVTDLAAAPGINPSLAQVIYDHVRSLEAGPTAVEAEAGSHDQD
ncbi:MAG: excinuclease ABC subunit UvrC [Deltaproteobacteria bacterium]|nr:excinuclease ABC subunit UvrC [Deltaproteobacteria bacterium]